MRWVYKTQIYTKNFQELWSKSQKFHSVSLKTAHSWNYTISPSEIYDLTQKVIFPFFGKIWHKPLWKYIP